MLRPMSQRSHRLLVFRPVPLIRAGRRPIAANLPDCLVCSRIERAVSDVLTKLQDSPQSRQFIVHAAPREVCVGFAPVLEHV